MQNKTRDSVNPAHYKDQCSIECIDDMKIAFGKYDAYIFCKLNVYKYLRRHKFKAGINDLDKARRYIEIAKEISNDDQLMEMQDLVEKYSRAYTYKPDEGYME